MPKEKITDVKEKDSSQTWRCVAEVPVRDLRRQKNCLNQDKRVWGQPGGESRFPTAGLGRSLVLHLAIQVSLNLVSSASPLLQCTLNTPANAKLTLAFGHIAPSPWDVLISFFFKNNLYFMILEFSRLSLFHFATGASGLYNKLSHAALHGFWGFKLRSLYLCGQCFALFHLYNENGVQNKERPEISHVDGSESCESL